MNTSRKDERIMRAQRAAVLRYAKQALSLTIAVGRAKTQLGPLSRSLGAIKHKSLSDADHAKAMDDRLRFRLVGAARIHNLYSTYLGLLYAAVERWEKWRFADLTVDALLTSEHKQVLEKHRHAIFHAEHYDAPDIERLSMQLGIVE